MKMLTTICLMHDIAYAIGGSCVECEAIKYRDAQINIVSKPPHYTNGIECIDFIESQGLDKDYHLANAIKYIVRCRHKGKIEEDIKKAIWYLERRLKNEILDAEEQR